MRRNDKIWAIAGTVIFHLLLLLLFWHIYLSYPPEGVKEWPPESQHEIVFDEVEELFATGEFVRTGDIADPTPLPDEPAPSDVSENVPTQDAPDPVNNGEAAQQPKVTTSERPSPAKVKKEKKGPTEEELRRQRERQEAKKQQQAKKTADKATSRAFGGKGKGTPGVADRGTTDNGETTGTPGNGLRGRSMESFGTTRGKKLGTIAVRVTVDPRGRVISANYSPGGSSGTAAADLSMRASCVAKSKECKFSVIEGSENQTGIISWVFK